MASNVYKSPKRKGSRSQDKIRREIRKAACPYDNSVAGATFKIIKTEFMKDRHFDSLEDLTRELQDYVYWFHHIRIHGTLGYVSPV
ncbi:IS3 family transposase [Ectobacillus panaciterrae]|uniref:IS3 family transposase n=1 Tax=Ectobacillus panaciterrae TaxID=363872 RepID=UPI0009D646DB|nr:IS3 family transposase [Ectobacillus panaciterrae]